MAIIYSYPLNQPKRDDLLIGTITYDEDAVNPVHGNPTVSFTIGSLLNLVSGQGNIQNLQQVTNIGNTTTNSIIVSNSLKVSGGYYDSSNQPGTAGQLLSSTATGTQWVNTVQGVTSVGLSMPAAFTVTNSPITQTGTLTVTGAGIAAQYINGTGNLATLLDIPGLITSLTTNGTSGVSTLVGRVLNIPNYANTQNTLTTTGTGAATLVGTVLNIPTPPTANFTSLTVAGTSGPSTLVSGVLTIPDYANTNDNTTYALASAETTTISLTSASPVGAAGAVELAGAGGTTVTGTGDIITITSTEIDTLQSVTARGASSSIATNFTGSLTVNGSNAGAYFYVGGNAQSTAPPLTYDTGMAMVWNNSGGSRENEMYYATGSGATQSDNDNSYFAFINRFNTAGTPVDTTTMKLYGSGELELAGPTTSATIRNQYWRMPTTAAPNTGYVLAKASGSINLEWVTNGGSIYQTTNITVSAAQISALNGSPVTLLPAPGVGKTYYFNQAFFWFEAGSVVYNLSTFNGTLYVTGGITNAITNMNSATSLMQYAALGGSSPTMNTDPATANTALILTNTGPNPTQGNGILYISISYEIKDLGPTIQAN